LVYDYFLDRQEEQALVPVFSQMPQIHNYEEIYKALDIRRSSTIDTQFPSWFVPYLSGTDRPLDHRLEILPFAQDREYSTYIVAPTIGAIAPIHAVTGSAYDDLFAGNEWPVLSLLEKWVVRQPHTLAPWEWIGNMVIAWHTSYFNRNSGRYKTIFQFISLLQTGDKITVYHKTWGQIFSYNYYVTQAYITDPEDVSILYPTTEKKRLTLYGCYPFGTIQDRWVVIAEMRD